MNSRNMILAKNIYRYRTQMKLTQEQLAEKTGVSRQSVSKWESGTAVPELEKISLLAEIFGVTVNDLLEDPDNISDSGNPDIHPQQEDDSSICNKFSILEESHNRLKKFFTIYSVVSGVLIAVLICTSIYNIYLVSELKNVPPQVTQVYSDGTSGENDNVEMDGKLSAEPADFQNGTVKVSADYSLYDYTDDTEMTVYFTNAETGKRVKKMILKHDDGNFTGTAALPLSCTVYKVECTVKTGNENRKQLLNDRYCPLAENMWIPEIYIYDSSSGPEYFHGGLNLCHMNQAESDYYPGILPSAEGVSDLKVSIIEDSSSKTVFTKTYKDDRISDLFTDDTHQLYIKTDFPADYESEYHVELSYIIDGVTVNMKSDGGNLNYTINSDYGEHLTFTPYRIGKDPDNYEGIALSFTIKAQNRSE